MDGTCGNFKGIFIFDFIENAPAQSRGRVDSILGASVSGRTARVGAGWRKCAEMRALINKQLRQAQVEKV